MKARILGCFVGAITLALLVSACDGDSAEIVITQSPTVAASATAARSATASATATPRASSTAAPSGTSARAATGTPAAATATATGTAPAGPAGYSTSCAAGYPWGQVVTGPFVCIESPISGTQVGSSVALSGYAGGSFENNLVIEIHDENDVSLGQQSLTYTSPDAGLPGSWQLTLAVPPGQTSGAPGRIVARFNSPRDGGVVATDSIEIRFP